MAALTTQQRGDVRTEVMRQLSDVQEPIAVTKPELLAALDALDDYIVANATAINTAIPQPARAALTTAQKARLLAYVVLKRYTTGA